MKFFFFNITFCALIMKWFNFSCLGEGVQVSRNVAYWNAMPINVTCAISELRTLLKQFVDLIKTTLTQETNVFSYKQIDHMFINSLSSLFGFLKSYSTKRGSFCLISEVVSIVSIDCRSFFGICNMLCFFPSAFVFQRHIEMRAACIHLLPVRNL